jgi:hypothetical protein
MQTVPASKFSFPHKIKKFAAGILVAGSITPQIEIANALGPLYLPLSDIRYEQVELCDGKPPIMPGQKAVRSINTHRN